MTKTIEAIYENGVFKPVHPVDWLHENEHVTLTYRVHPLADVAGIMPDEDAKDMQKIIDEEFGKVDPNDWK